MAFPVTSGRSMEIFGGRSGGIFWPEEVPPVLVGSPLWRAKRPVTCPWGYSWTSRERRKCSRIKYHAVQQPDFLRKVFGWFVPITTKRPTTLYMPWSDSEEKPSTKRPRKKPPREDNEAEEGGGAGEGGAGGGGGGGGLDEAGPGGGGPGAGGDGPAGGPAETAEAGSNLQKLQRPQLTKESLKKQMLLQTNGSVGVDC
ncbi:proline-rich protein 2-like [Drosophila madeirensis]|uniref:Proline-rich protein 2-like n=1 Tax=Drosophila madeirensis TaxID=30013 RepID=A0AAU9G8V4_DROMD